MNQGLFITFEGVDGAGKSTQSKLTNEYLKNKGYDVLMTREPGGTPISEDIRKIILDPNNKTLVDEAEALLFAAARIQHVKQVILPSLKENKIILSDRYIYSSFAYQHYARGTEFDWVKQINKYAIKPSLTLCYMLTYEQSIERLKLRNQTKDRMEENDKDFFEKVRNGFIELQNYDKDFILIDASGTEDEVFKKTIEIINKYICK